VRISRGVRSFSEIETYGACLSGLGFRVRVRIS